MPRSRTTRAPDDVLVHLRRARDLADREYAEELDLARLAAVAGFSKYHFLRLFTATYGVTPADYVSRRRIERAQDLLRATNLTVTEVCHAVGFSSLGSFSSRFRAVVGESPSAFQHRYAGAGVPRIPGCYVFMWGLAERRDASAKQEKRTSERPAQPRAMIKDISIVSVFVKDQDEAKRFYTDVMGFEEGDDVTLGEGYRWCTVINPRQPEIMVNLAVPGPPLDPELVEAMKRAQDAGGLNGLGFSVDDCHQTYADLTAKGVEFIQPPSERPYGIEAVCRDNSGNWMVLVEQNNAAVTSADFDS